MPRPEATPEQKAEARREIRKAAAAIYNSEGLGGISVRAIAKEAGVSVGTIYTYFGSLQGLMESLWKGPVDRLGDELRAVADRTEDPVERVHSLLQTYLKFAKDNPNIYRGVFLYVRPLNKPSPIREPAENALLPTLLKAAILEGQTQARFKAGDAGDYAMMLWGSLHGCLALPNNFGRLEFQKPNEVSDGIIDVVLSALVT